MISVLRLFGGICIAAAILTSVACSPATPEEVEAAIARYPLLAEANRLCLDTPTPPGFRLLGKRTGSNSLRALIEFGYRSDEPSRQVLSFYEDWFERNGWEPDGFAEGKFGSAFYWVRYRNGRYSITVNKSSVPNENYSVDCSIWKDERR